MMPLIKLPTESKQQQHSHALVLQGYCRTVLAQQPLNLDKLGAVANVAEIKDIARKLDETLGRAKDHARSYLDDLQPRMIADTVALRAWITRAKLFPDTLGKDLGNWRKGIDLLVRDTTRHGENALGCKVALERLRDGFQQDTLEFEALAGRLNTLISGEKGALKNLESELGALQTKINGLIAATTLGFLAAAAGVLMMIVGAVGSVFTGGAAGALIIGGFALTAGGIIGGGVAAAELKRAYDQQRSKLEDQSRLNGAVTILTGAAKSLDSIAKQGNTVVDATLKMAAAWNTLGSSLGQVKETLTDESLQELRDTWNGELRAKLITLEADLNRNLDQLAGVHVEQTVGNVYLFEHPTLITAVAA